MRIIRRLMEVAVQMTVADTTGQLPSRVSAASVLEGGSGFLHDVARLLPEATTRPAVPEYERVSVQLRHLLAATLSGGSVPGEVRLRGPRHLRRDRTRAGLSRFELAGRPEGSRHTRGLDIMPTGRHDLSLQR